MWQNWLLGILGLWVILMPFLALPSGLHRTLTVVTGIVVAILGFWSASAQRDGSASAQRDGSASGTKTS